MLAIEPLHHLIQTLFTVAAGSVIRPNQLIAHSLRYGEMLCDQALGVGKQRFDALFCLIELL